MPTPRARVHAPGEAILMDAAAFRSMAKLEEYNTLSRQEATIQGYLSTLSA